MSTGFDKESLRLNAVQRILELQNSERQDLDDLIEVASEICGTPIALVTIIDEKKQWFRAKKGLEGYSTTREESFCRYTIEEDGLFIVEDAQQDVRFVSNPYVIGEPKIRFYAGAPLTTQGGLNVGSLCVIDHKPRQLNAVQLSCLKTLARQAMHRMELNISLQTLQDTVKELKKQKEDLQELTIIHNSFLNSFNDHFILVDKDLNIITCNESWFKYANAVFRKKPAKGDAMADYLSGELKPDFEQLAQAALAGEEVNFERIVTNNNANAFWCKGRFAAFRNFDKEIIGISIILTNINEEKEQGNAIAFQNKTLAEIARLQSHNVRGPLTNVLGLLNIIKANNFSVSEQYFSMLYQSATKLDEVIRDIVFKADKAKHVKQEAGLQPGSGQM